MCISQQAEEKNGAYEHAVSIGVYVRKKQSPWKFPLEWFYDYGLQLCSGDQPGAKIWNDLNSEAFASHIKGEYDLFNSILSKLVALDTFTKLRGYDTPEATDDLISLMHFMRKHIHPEILEDFKKQACNYGEWLFENGTLEPFYSAAVFSYLALLTRNTIWVGRARLTLPDIPMLTKSLFSEIGPLAALRWLRALRFVSTHRTAEANHSIALIMRDLYLGNPPLKYHPLERTLNLYISMLPFLPPGLKNEIKWIAEDCINSLAEGGHPLLLNAAAISTSNWDNIEPLCPLPPKESK